MIEMSSTCIYFEFSDWGEPRGRADGSKYRQGRKLMMVMKGRRDGVERVRRACGLVWTEHLAQTFNICRCGRAEREIGKGESSSIGCP